MPRVRFEQAVYGSFPFWDRGYALLAASPGCRPSCLAEFQVACQRYGEPPPGTPSADALFSMRLTCGAWLIVGVGPQGSDDRGRPGALAFHGLFLTPREFARAAFNPFALAAALRRRWGSDDIALGSGSIDVERNDAVQSVAVPEARPIAEALARGRRVAVESAAPIDDLARRVWQQLSPRARKRASLATLSYSTANGFSLIAMPKLGDESGYLTLDHMEERRSRGPWPQIAAGGLVAAVLLAASVLAVRGCGGDSIEVAHQPATAVIEPSLPRAPDERPLPRPTSSPAVDPDESQRVTEGLLDLAARFGLDANPGADPTALMADIAVNLRYRGPWLSAAELTRLRADASPDSARALALHEHLRHFASDRPLPADFDKGPLSWQLQALAWSFRVTPHPGQTPAELPFALADALAMDRPVRPSPLEAQYPALAEYHRFLVRLPRR